MPRRRRDRRLQAILSSLVRFWKGKRHFVLELEICSGAIGMSWSSGFRSVAHGLLSGGAQRLVASVRAHKDELRSVGKIGGAALVAAYAPSMLPMYTSLISPHDPETDSPAEAFPPPTTMPEFRPAALSFLSGSNPLDAIESGLERLGRAAGRDIREFARGVAPEVVGTVEGFFEDEDVVDEDVVDEDQVDEEEEQ